MSSGTPWQRASARLAQQARATDTFHVQQEAGPLPDHLFMGTSASWRAATAMQGGRVPPEVALQVTLELLGQLAAFVSSPTEEASSDWECMP
jgi:hypothetical protein